MYVPVNVEIDYKATGPQLAPANTTQTLEFPAPEGWTGISWGFTGIHPILEFQDAGFARTETGQQVFRAVVRNPSGTDRFVRFTFLLMKV